jgi:activator of 2-hydroxyglutaryl-CoA dehydratase
MDAGSTTTKLLLIDTNGNILWQSYSANGGSPVVVAVQALQSLYKQLPKDVKIGRAISTGYGERLFQVALNVDGGEVETIARSRRPNSSCLASISS